MRMIFTRISNFNIQKTEKIFSVYGYENLPKFSTWQGKTSVSPTTARYVWPRDRKRGWGPDSGLDGELLSGRLLVAVNGKKLDKN